MNGFLLFRLFDPEAPLSLFGPAGPTMRERIALIGAILLVGMAAMTALLVRKQLKHRRSHRHEHRRRRPFQRTAAGVAELKKMIPEKPRHRRREHRPRNPTLAETGGLPPLRSDVRGEPSSPTSPSQ